MCGEICRRSASAFCRVARPNWASIPTPVGKPRAFSGRMRILWVYPHSCGETSSSTIPHACLSGLSPHLWGNHHGRQTGHRMRGSIPTPVGKPLSVSADTVTPEVYPHICGETIARDFVLLEAEGLSPHLWGNRFAVSGCQAFLGSIPTPVGKPVGVILCKAITRVYPHTCGETLQWFQYLYEAVGLSPHLWGNPIGSMQCCSLSRSIPTPVGKPLLQI